MSAERRQQLQTDKERAERQAQMEAERNDFETARRLQMEEERISRQQAELLRTADRGFECPICMDLFSVGAKSQADPCGHALCRKCMVSAIKAELESRRWPIQCPLCRVTPPENGEHGGKRTFLCIS
jgi:Ring finger domain